VDVFGAVDLYWLPGILFWPSSCVFCR